MRFDLTPVEAEFLRMLLRKELEETRVEIHHTRNLDYKSMLQLREKEVQELMAKLEVHISV